MKPVELKFPVKSIDSDGKEIEVKYLTPSRLKVKHIDLLPESLIEQAQKEKDSEEEGFKLKFDMKELIPMFSDLKPFLASIFNVSEQVVDDIDFEDIEEVIGGLEQVFPDEDQKKN